MNLKQKINLLGKPKEERDSIEQKPDGIDILDNCSANSIINEGIRHVIKQKLQELSTLRKSIVLKLN